MWYKHFIIGFIGRTGSGKTWKMRQMLKRLKRVIIIDPQREFTEYPTAYNLDEFKNMISGKKQFRIACSFDFTENDDESEYAELFSLIFYNIHNCNVAIDEVHLFAGTGIYKTLIGLKRMILTGRGFGINILWTSQRPANVSSHLFSQSLIIFAFRLLDARDIKNLPYRWRNKEGEIELSNLKEKANDYRLVRGTEDEIEDIFGKNWDK